MQSVSKHMQNGHKGVENFSLQKAFIFEQLSFEFLQKRPLP